jgi:hypothetical protein
MASVNNHTLLLEVTIMTSVNNHTLLLEVTIMANVNNHSLSANVATMVSASKQTVARGKPPWPVVRITMESVNHHGEFQGLLLWVTTYVFQWISAIAW